MKSIAILALLLLASQISTLTCDQGFYADTDADPDTDNTKDQGQMCYPCPSWASGCTVDLDNGEALISGFSQELSGCTIQANEDITSNLQSNNITCYCFASQLISSNFGMWLGSGAVSTYGYNSQTEKCDLCTEGCATCFVDVNVCVTCHSGYEYHSDSYTCARAQLGLAAVVLALSVVILILGIIGCMKAKQ